MLKKILIVFISLTNQTVFSQITFQKTYGGTNHDYGHSCQQTVDVGYIIAGYSRNFGAGGYSDVYLIKTDANGDSLWTKAFGGTNEDRGYSVQQTSDGGYIVTGYTYSFGAGSSDVYLIKTDVNGNSLWTKTFGGTNDDMGYSVIQTTDGGYIIAGLGLFDGSYTNVYLIKTDVNGDTLWTKTFGGTPAQEDVANSVQQTTDGGYIITGYTESFGVGGTDVYLIKTDSLGNLLWSKTFGGAFYDYGRFVEQTTDGGYIITGLFENIGGYYNVYLIKTNANGDSLWTKTFDGGGSGYCVHQTMDGGYIIARNAYNSNFIKADPNGNPIWTKAYPGSGSLIYSVQQTSDDGYSIAGSTNNFGAGLEDFHLIKTDSLGNSGCNESITVTTVSTSLTQVTSPATIVTSPPTIVTTPATQVNSGATVTTLCSTVGIPSAIQNPQSAISISPNPFHSSTVLKLTNEVPTNNSHLLIYSLQGTLVRSIPINEKETTISRKGIEAGLYLYKLISESEIIGSGKLVIY